MRKEPKPGMTRITTLLLIGFMTIAPLRRAHAGHVTGTIVAPASITDQVGTHSGSVGALAVKDQTGTQNDPTKYVQFGTPPGSLYQGYLTFTLPTSVTPSQITTLTFIANVFGPSAGVDAFTWSIFNWTTNSYEILGNQNDCGGTGGLHPCSNTPSTTTDSDSFAKWKWIQYMALGRPLTQYVNSAGRIQVQLVSQNNTGYLNVDYAIMDVFTNDGVPGTLWIPPQNYRWQYQIQVNSTDAANYSSTDGINVNICVTSFLGGACVTPNVIDMDFNVDNIITNPSSGSEFIISDLYTPAVRALAALHNRGAHAIAYGTVGDAEVWRADYQQMVDFDNACSGCFIGSVFSHTFSNEMYVNINNDKGQADFMRKIYRGRMDRAAAAGFESFEPDVMVGAGNKTGFTISCATQLAYNLNVAADAHVDNMSVAAKDLGYACSDATYELNNQQVVNAFDYVIDEQCWQYGFCQDYNNGTYNFYGAGKAIFNVEYPLSTSKFCPQANADNFNSIKKAKDQSVFDLPYTPCR
ncbi:MAG: endo alpha-1,4 polygalactosaminidase [Candidatus Sulfotelmatobacter sp.]